MTDDANESSLCYAEPRRFGGKRLALLGQAVTAEDVDRWRRRRWTMTVRLCDLLPTLDRSWSRDDRIFKLVAVLCILTIPLAGAIHGLGLLTVSAMALSGVTIFFGMGPHGAMGPFVATLRKGHMLMGNILWVYFFGHAGISLLHQLRGDRLITNMFNLFRRQSVS